MANRTLGFLFLAHNEAEVIGESIRSIASQKAAGDEVYVVADHCADETESVARTEGARVFSCTSEKSAGKGAALKWFFSAYYDKVQRHEALVVLDADTHIGENFVSVVRKRLGEGESLFQCHIQPLYKRENQIAVLSAFSELVDQLFGDTLRSRLGWSVRLRGTGMVISPRLLKIGVETIATYAEDIALTLILAAKGKTIERLADARVFDPKVRKVRGAVNQRSRWFRGQIQSLLLYWREVLRVVLQGPRGWSLLASLFLRPKSLLAVLCLLGATGIWNWGSGISLALFAVFTSYLIPIMYGLATFSDKRVFLRSFWSLPGFIGIWLVSIVRSIWTSEWESGRT